MKIVRDGKEFELTIKELDDAWLEVEHKIHRADVIDYLGMWCDDNGILAQDERKKYLENDSLIDDITEEYEDRLERNLSYYDPDWREEVYEAAHVFLPLEEE